MHELHAVLEKMNSRVESERREILRHVSSLFLERSAGHGDRESEIFGRIFTELLDTLPSDDRLAFSDRFATVPTTPADVALRIADDDDPQVAAPMLEHSPVLTDATLIALAERRGPEHLVAIARRERIGADLGDVLVDRGDAIVLETVSRNAGAAFSDRGLTRLTRAAVDLAPVAEALFGRLDISRERFDRILASLDDAARERLARLTLTDGVVAAVLLRNSLEAAAARREREREETEAMIALVGAGTRRLDGCLDDLVHDGRLDDLARLLAAVADLPQPHLAAVLSSRNDFGLALVCRSLEVGEATWVELDRLRRTTAGMPAVSPAEAVATYREVDRDSAERALRFHRIRAKLR